MSTQYLDQSWVWDDGVDDSIEYHMAEANWHIQKAIEAASQRWDIGTAIECCHGMIQLPSPIRPLQRIPSYQKAEISHRLAKRVFERDKYRCSRCSTWLDLTCDHIIPESKGGATTLANLQTLCRRCNSRKGRKS